MGKMVKYTLEFPIKSSKKVLFNRLSTPGGLNEWFADDVRVTGSVYTFFWDGYGQEAELATKKDMKLVKFKWIDDEEGKEFFEFKINTDELTGDVALMITDFAEDDELEDAKNLWETQVSKLKHILGT
jgi:hypothetical protein